MQESEQENCRHSFRLGCEIQTAFKTALQRSVGEWEVFFIALHGNWYAVLGRVKEGESRKDTFLIHLNSILWLLGPIERC